jgi:DUF2075 family protein
MRLYSGNSKQFVQDSILNQIAEKLKNAFFIYYRYNPSPNEINSWKNSLRATAQVLQYANLMDNGILLEYQLPLSSKRLDCMICGKDQENKENAVIIELKQWDKCSASECVNEVMTYVGGGIREVLHPSAQVDRYKTYLKDCHTAFYEDNPINLYSCSYLHNYNYYETDVLYDEKFKDLLNESPLFTGDHVQELSDYLIEKLDGGEGEEVLQKIEESKYRPSKKLMQHVSGVIKGKSEYILLDEQLIVYDKVFASAHKAFHDKQKSVIIVKGGPGTGKSVIAINLMADLLKKDYNAHYSTGSKAFTETLRAIIGLRGSSQFKYFNSYANAEYNAVDVLICDEAHRIRKTSNNMYTPAAKRSELAQLEEIVKAAKVTVFFIDDDQVVRPDEIGSVAYIKEYAEKAKCRLFEFELEAQFRCNGSDGFVNWINNTLGVKRTANVIWDNQEAFDFQIFSSPENLESAIRNKLVDGNTARLTAGFCWAWSQPNPDGTLINDVKIGDFNRPWNAKPDAKKLAINIPKAPLWAYDPNGINQIGCVYTAQGFEFDYVGVIWGKDLIYNLDASEWQADNKQSYDTTVKRSKDKFIDLVKNTYRVLLSRGMKGCYVYFEDKDTERFFRSRIEKNDL